MCLPAVALPIAAAAMSAVGSLTSGMAGLQQGNYEARVANANAALDAGRAQDSLATAATENRDFYRQLSAVKGQQIASLAANGVDLSFGTPALLQEDTANKGSEDAATLHHNQLERVKGFDVAAVNDREQAAAAQMKGRSAMVNSVFQAGSSLMGGFSQASMMRSRLGLTGG
jgi:hypothetical protein